MVYAFILPAILFSTLCSCAQTAPVIWGARAASLGNCSALVTDGGSVRNNPATLQSQQSSAWFCYEARPALTGADRISAVVMGKLFSGALAAGLFRFGDDLYSEQQVVIAYSHAIGSTSIGLATSLWQQSTPTDVRLSDLSFSFGGVTQIGNAIRTGAFITNFNQAIGANEMLPVRMVAGIACRLSDQFELMTEVDKDIDHDAQYRTGMEFNYKKKIFFRTGFNLHPAIATFGMGVAMKRLAIDFAFQNSGYLGTAIQCATTWRFFQKSKS